MENNKVLVKIRNLKKYFPIKDGILNRTVNHVKAVDNISFDIYQGEVLGLVGESGCGKSTTGRVIIHLDKPSSGEVEFDDISLSKISGKDMQNARKNMQIIFQDPMASLNPRKTIFQTIKEPLDIVGWKTPEERIKRVYQIAEEVGIQFDYLGRLPHEFSGGQRQRICIARALAVYPQFVVADEAVSALDVSVQAQVINLMVELKKKYNLTYLFISHDMRVIRHICDRIAVMYLGKIVEMSPKKEIFDNPMHPYTQALLSAVPAVNQAEKRERIILQGDVGNPMDVPSGCPFHPRCPKAQEICKKEIPELKEVKKGHYVACHLSK